MKKISIIIPCRNEEKYIKDFLESVLSNDYPKEFMEILIIDGKSTDNTLSFVKDFSQKYAFIKLFINEKQTTPIALNIGVRNSTGDFIIRLDVHTKIPTNYFSKLISSAVKLMADNVGTVVITDVKNKTPKSLSIKKVLSNKFGVGNSYFRIGIDEIKEVDTVPFGCFRKEVFEKVGLFNEDLDRDQDIELNKRIKKNGGRIFLVPHIHSTYFARETYSALAANNFSTGMWNILTVYITKRLDSMSLRHFIPLIFLLSILMPLIFIFYIPSVGLISILSLISYLALLFTTSIRIVDDSTSVSHIMIGFFVLHFSYGIGSLVGLFRLNYLLKD